MLIAPGDKVVTSLGAYPTFNYHVAGCGGELHTVPYNGFFEDPSALLQKTVEQQAPLVYFANPDNPMGTWHDGATLSHALDDLPDGCLLVLDEAKIRNHFGLNRVAQVGALVSLQDQSFLAEVLHQNAEARERIMQLASKHHLYAEPSSTNFVAVDMGNNQRAQAMIQALAERDVFMRMPGVAPLNRCIRVGLCRSDDYGFFARAFEDSLTATTV